jgi:hypothetical protein
MRLFGRRHYREIVLLIRNGDIAGDGPTFTLAAGVVRLAPFIEPSRRTIRQGNPHILIPFIHRAQRHIWGQFLRFADKSLGSILSVKSQSVFPPLHVFPYTYEVAETLSVGSPSDQPERLGFRHRPFCWVRGARGHRMHGRRFCEFDAFRGKHLIRDPG